MTMLRLLSDNKAPMTMESQQLLGTLNAIQSFPVLIMICGAPIDNLRAEQGGPPDEALSEIASCLADGDTDVYGIMPSAEQL